MMSVPPTPTSIRSNSTTTSRSSLFRYYVDQHQDQQELARLRTLLAQKESENAALRQALFQWQNKADTYQNMHETLRRRIWSLESELDAMTRTHVKRADDDAALIASLSQENETLREMTDIPICRQQPLRSSFSGHSSSIIDISDPCTHAEETYNTAVSQIALDCKKSESLVLGIHDMVRAIEAELAYLEAPPTSSEDEYEYNMIKPPSPPEDGDIPCLLTMKNDTPQGPPSPQTIAAPAPMIPQRPPALPRQRSQSMIQTSSIATPATRRNKAAVLTAETISQSAVSKMAAAVDGTSNRLMLHCQKQQDPRRRSAFLLGNLSSTFAPQQQQQQQKPINTLSEQWKISSSKRP